MVWNEGDPVERVVLVAKGKLAFVGIGTFGRAHVVWVVLRGTVFKGCMWVRGAWVLGRESRLLHAAEGVFLRSRNTPLAHTKRARDRREKLSSSARKLSVSPQPTPTAEVADRSS